MLLFLIMSVLVLHSLHAAGRYYIMITPAFDLSQDPDYLTICIRVPYTRTSEFDLFIDGADFKFYAKPYFLRLSLPGRIVEDGTEKATFDIDKGVFTLKAPKETRGEHFGGLQMLTSLLAPKGSRSAKLLVEDMSAETGSETTGDGEEEEDEEEFDWQLEQEVYTDRSEEKLGTMQKYGFANQRSGVFGRLQEELSDVIDVKNPEETLASERRRARLEAEALAFSSDHYLADLFEDDEINRLLKFTPWWSKLSPSTEQKGESDFQHKSDFCHLQKYSDDSAGVGFISDGQEAEYRELVDRFVSWCGNNHLILNVKKTREIIVNFKRNRIRSNAISIMA
ncbi:protein SHQ1 homolog isoform X2 [Poecilia latipinna]|uniref:protein SHQ1 homolog isoform X2 n=1 Tax=Poecilia latipinna TaxID=48699 RepID=UPI00072DD54B|nr:PREDICTED: protein SHQ1 homolog isoform X2 [Poecilia latipinna]